MGKNREISLHLRATITNLNGFQLSIETTEVFCEKVFAEENYLNSESEEMHNRWIGYRK